MYKFWIILKKEIIQISSDVVGLTLMFFLPLMLVFIITSIQNGAYEAINENKLEIAVNNKDEGKLGDQLLEAMESSKMFLLEKTDKEGDALKSFLVNNDKIIALEIPRDFSKQINSRTAHYASKFLAEDDSAALKKTGEITQEINFFYDPMLKENYVFSIVNAIKTHLNVIQSQLILSEIYNKMDLDVEADQIVDAMMNQELPVNEESAQIKNSQSILLPENATQHNVPAWTIFAMFFMVVSLGNNIVKEKNNGSFLRVRLAPTNFFNIISAKLLTYLGVALLQILLIFSMGMYIFPYLGMTALILPSNTIGFVLICFLCSLLAVSFAMMIGALAQTSEQANGLGATLVVIFGAIGGIWVPVFVMPDFMQTLSYFSPMRWCLEGFYLLFLHNAGWSQLSGIILFLVIFIVVSQAITYLRLRLDNLV